ncbi:phage major capsid protein [Roseovarius sp. D0-M9]|uniref:phage major capsid protein n=1 Tax=Roseovarius sp. D0-M9 TaxID=3127117 RepID=UPI003010494D
MTTQQTNMQELHRDLKAMNTIAPQMKQAVEAARDHEKRLSQVEQTASLAYETAKRGADAALQGMSSGNTKGQHVATTPHVRAFKDWLRAPQDSNRRADLVAQEMDVRAAGSTQTGAGGGFAVPEPVADTIRARVLEISPMRRLASNFSVTSTGTKFLVNRNNATSAWVGETDPRTDTGEPTLDLRGPTYGTTFGLIEATEELLLDAAIDIGAWFSNAVAQKIAQAEGSAFVSGNGTNKPTGFLAGPTPLATGDSTRAAGTLQYVPTGDAALIKIDSLSDLFFATKAQHRQSGTWLMSSATAAVIAKLKDGDGRSLWQTSLSADTPSTLLGRPVVYDENMPAVAGNAFPVAFGDFSAGYLIADSGALRITTDDNITKPGYVRWYVRRRVGGVIYDSDAIKLLKVATT